jgi:hypothetical protein
MLPGTPSRTVSLGADANPINAREFWRLFAWGGSTVLALTIAAIASRTELGAQRASAAFAAMLSPPPSQDQQMSEQMTAWSSGFDKQLRRQTEVIRALAGERDSLADKVASLEHQLTELSGTLVRTTARLEGETRSAQQAAAAASVAAASASRLAQARPEPPESPAQTVATIASSAPSAAPGRIAPGTAAQAAPTHASPPQPPPGPPLNLLPPGQIAPPASAGFPPPAAQAPAYTGTIPMPAAAEPSPNNGPPGMMRPFPAPQPEPRASPGRPTPPAAPSLSSAPRAPLFQSNPLLTTGIFDAPAAHAPAGTEFAVDLGTAPTVEALRGRWNEVRASQSPLFDNMKPLIAIKEGRSGQELHLIAGPLTNNGAGTRLCAALSGSWAPCQPTLYEGQRLAPR